MTGPVIFTPAYDAEVSERERAGWWNAGMRHVASALLDLAALGPTGRLLDAGCGSGGTLAWFTARHPGWRAVGFDLSPHAVQAASELAVAPVARASALRIPIASASCDLVISHDVLQHLPLDGGDLEALAEFHRVLAPGGWLLLRTNAQAWPPTADDRAASFHRYVPAELRAKLSHTGFEVVRASRVNAILGWIEGARQLGARRASAEGYHGLPAPPRSGRAASYAGPRVLRLEGRLVRAGFRLPAGRSIVALCRRGQPVR